jgi:Rps23 Pro-64 3,4-dihydroxylase Tpa1-like proline 4-hydroxylase
MRSAPLWNFTQPLAVIPFRPFGQFIGPIINILIILEVLTSHSLIDVYREIIKLYTLL